MALSKGIDANQIQHMFEQGYSNKQIENELNIKSSTVCYWKRKLGFRLRDIHEATNDKSDDYDWVKIQEWYDVVYPINAVSAKFKIPRATLCEYIRRGFLKTRDHVDASTDGYIYIMYSQILNKIKIGITNNLEKRLFEIQDGVPDAVYRYNKKSTYGMVVNCEKATHALFEHHNQPIYKCGGYTEWFASECYDDVILYIEEYL